MPNLLTDERLREELRIFTKGALRTELQELGDRIHRDVSQELESLRPATEIPNLVISRSTERTNPNLMRRGSSSISRMLAKDSDSSKLVASRPSTRTSGPRKEAHNSGSMPRQISESQAEWGPDFEDDSDCFIRRLRSYKVAENTWNVGVVRRSTMERSVTDRREPRPQGHRRMDMRLASMDSLSEGGPAPMTTRQSIDTVGEEAVQGARRGNRAVTDPPKAPPGQPVDLSTIAQLAAGPVGPHRRRAESNPKEVVSPVASHPHTPMSPAQVEPPQSHPHAAFVQILPEVSPLTSLTTTVLAPTIGREDSSEEEGPPARSGTRKVSQISAWSLGSGEKAAFQAEMSQLYYHRDHKRQTRVQNSTVQPNLSPRTMTSVGLHPAMSRFDRWTCYLELLVENNYFHQAMALVVLANLFTVGMETNRLADELTERTPIGFVITEAVFCVIFVLEFMARLFVYRCQFFCMPGWHWNIFDGVMVLLQLADQVLEVLVATSPPEDGPGQRFSFGFLRALRILRVIRQLRAARILEHVRELQMIVLSIGGSLRSLCWTLMLLALLIYTVGVTFTQAVVNHRLGLAGASHDSVTQHYGSLGTSIFTLYGSIMGGIDWMNAAEPLLEEVHPILAILYALYVAFAVLAMMNVVTGVFVDASLKTARDHQEAFLLTHASNLFEDADLDESGNISWPEFSDRLDHPHMVEFFKSIDVDISEAETVFHLLDFNECGKIDLEQFMGGCLRLRGPAKAVDLAMLMQETRRNARRNTKQLSVLLTILTALARRHSACTDVEEEDDDETDRVS